MKTKIHYRKRLGLTSGLLLAGTLLLSGPAATTVEAYATSSWTEIYSGVWYATGSNSSPLMKAYALRFDTRNPWISFKSTKGNGGSAGQTTRRTTLQFRSDENASAAINANYYQVTGSGANIEGLLISYGTLVSGGNSYGHRPCQLRITADRMADLVDSTASPGGLHTGIAGSVWPLLAGGTLGENSEYNPRTGLGLSQDKRYIIMVVIDGRQPGHSNGATTKQLGQWLKDFGAWNGMMLDGGGSSTLVAQGSVKNKPSDGSPRSVGANFGANAPAASTPKPGAENPAMAVDTQGRVWFAHVTDEARVRTRRYDPSSDSWSGMTHHTNDGFAFGVSKNASPAIVVHPNGDVRLFAVSASGQMFTRVRSESSGNWGNWNAFGTGWSPDSGPVAVLRTNDEISVAALTMNGTLMQRTWSSGSWLSWNTHGVEDSWSPYAQPCLIAGNDGKLHLLATKKTGAIFSRYWSSGTGWTGWTEHGQPTWSRVAGIVGIPRTATSANVSYAAVKANGLLYHRTWTGSSWGSFTEHVKPTSPNWSAYQRPGLVWSNANNRLYVFATNTNGTSYSRSWTDGSGWSSWSQNGTDWSTHVGVTGIVVPSGGMVWTSVKADGTLRSRRQWANGNWQSQMSHSDGWVK